MQVIHKAIRAFAETVALNKGRAFFVGGSVRDEMLNAPIKDIDIEVHGISPRALRKIIESHFANVEEVGAAFGVLHTTMEDVEVDISLPRRDSKIGQGHKGFAVDVDPLLSPKEALRRRDFTINAMLKDVLSDEIVDPFGGRDDLRARILRPVDFATFVEDPLRVLRAVQLTARFNLAVSDDVKALLRSMVPALQELSRDRHRDEWRKLFLKAHTPSRGLELARLIGVFDALPIVAAMKATPQEPEWHPEGDVWIHTGMVCDVAAKLCKRERLEGALRLVIMLSAFCHDLGKPETTQMIKGRIRSHQHSHVGIRHVRDVLEFFGMESLRDTVEPLVAYHLTPYDLYHQQVSDSPPGDGAIFSLARRVHPATIDQLLLVAEADMLGRGPFLDDFAKSERHAALDWLGDRACTLDVRDRRPPDVIRGNDLLALGMKPGPHFGKIVRAANLWHDCAHVQKAEIFDRIKTLAKTASDDTDWEQLLTDVSGVSR